MKNLLVFTMELFRELYIYSKPRWGIISSFIAIIFLAVTLWHTQRRVEEVYNFTDYELCQTRTEVQELKNTIEELENKIEELEDGEAPQSFNWQPPYLFPRSHVLE